MSDSLNQNVWFRLLTLFDHVNHLIKEGDWYEQDKQEFYELKDKFLSFIIKYKPKELELKMYYIPYYKYSNYSKDKAGELMRKDFNKKPFEYYLSLIEPCNEDIELPEKATIELEITFQDIIFSFHIPQEKIKYLVVMVNELPKKAWISGQEFHQEQFKKIKNELNKLLEVIIKNYA